MSKPIFHKSKNIKSENEYLFLLQYEGGGYDGCIWEWNYSLFRLENKEKSHDTIFASGYHGRKELKDFRGLTSTWTSWNGQKMKNTRWYLYNMLDDNDYKDFCTNCEPSHVKAILNHINNNYDYDLEIDCPICNQNIPPEEMIMGSYHGDGGIGVVYTDWHCLSCDVVYRCDNCNEFDETTETRDDLSIEYDNALCDYCYKEKKEKLEEQEERENFVHEQILIKALSEGAVLSALEDYGREGYCYKNIADTPSTIFATIDCEYPYNTDGKHNYSTLESED